MKKEQIQENGISRRGFLKRTALAGAAICIAPALEKVTAAEKPLQVNRQYRQQPFQQEWQQSAHSVP